MKVKNIIAVKGRKEDARNSEYYIAENFVLKSDYIAEKQQIPLFDLDAFAGLVTANVEERETDDYVVLENLPVSDGAMHVRGNSMYPLLLNGDIVLYKTVPNRRGGLYFGKMYVVAFVEDGEEHIVIKYVEESQTPGYFTLKSCNPDYAPFDVLRDSVRAMAIVKASIREMM